MGEYFRGWKRKLGVVTLLMACIAIAGWVRSIGREEGVMLQSKGYYPVMIDSRNHFVTAIIARHATRSIDFTRLMIDWFTDTSSEESNFEHWTLANMNAPHVVVRPWVLGGIIVATSYDTTPSNPLKKWFVSVPYWCIVVPLTLLSAYLLLSKPRQKPSTPLQDVHQ